MTKKKSGAKRRVAQNQTSQSKQWIWLAAVAGLVVVAIIGGLLLFQPSPSTPETAGAVAQLPDSVSVEEAYQKYQEGTFVLDVRTPEEWEDFHAPNTTLIPLNELGNRVDEVPRGEEIVVVCRSGNRSQVGRDILRQAGFELVTSMDGGLNAWRAAGYPVE